MTDIGAAAGAPGEISYAEELNAQQLEAVTYMDGPCLVVAGAGSGKTRMLTYKIAYLLQHGFMPHRIMALTFTNKAAKEMKARIMRLVGRDVARGLWAGTFHSVFARILRAEAAAIGYEPDFTIYDTTDTKSLIKKIIKEKGLDEKQYKPSTVAARISAAKNRLFDAVSYAEDNDFAERDRHTGMPAVSRIFMRYSERLRKANAMDFDDLLLWTYKLFSLHKDIRERYRKRFSYLLVDEYQDTNLVQYQIVRLLANEEGRVCAVGDDAQSIYAFRGAEIANILNFDKAFPNTKVFRLERNYRSTQNIVNAANTIIAHNRNRIPKRVYSEQPAGEKIRIFSAYSDKDESAKIVKEVLFLKKSRRADYDEMAVLYRTNAQSRVLEEACKAAGVPYRVYGGLSFYQRKEVKDFMAYLRLCCNPADEEALMRVINFPARGIGDTTLLRLLAAARDTGVSMWDIIKMPDTALGSDDPYRTGIARRTLYKLYDFRQMIEGFMADAEEMPPYQLAVQIVKASGLEADMIRDRDTGGVEAENRINNTRELLNSISDFQAQRTAEGETARLADYLAQVSLLTDQDRGDDGRACLTLMTVHAAKGLEFKAVFVSGMEDNLFPAASAKFRHKEMEEERRLFYVAVTRAKEYCYLSFAQSRRRYGQTDMALPSPFLDEIDREYVVSDSNRLSHWQKGPKRVNTPLYQPSSQMYANAVRTPYGRRTDNVRRAADVVAASAHSSDAPQDCHYNPGDQVAHDRFGRGTVMSIEGSGQDTRITIDFGSLGEKKLLLKFAKLTPIT